VSKTGKEYCHSIICPAAASHELQHLQLPAVKGQCPDLPNTQSDIVKNLPKKIRYDISGPQMRRLLQNWLAVIVNITVRSSHIYEITEKNPQLYFESNCYASSSQKNPNTTRMSMVTTL
jgi:hypothetical protein